eukprot:ANDGO_03130.mRNA.1 hypothetical protein
MSQHATTYEILVDNEFVANVTVRPRMRIRPGHSIELVVDHRSSQWKCLRIAISLRGIERSYAQGDNPSSPNVFHPGSDELLSKAILHCEFAVFSTTNLLIPDREKDMFYQLSFVFTLEKKVRVLGWLWDSEKLESRQLKWVLDLNRDNGLRGMASAEGLPAGFQGSPDGDGAFQNNETRDQVFPVGDSDIHSELSSRCSSPVILNPG